MDYRPIITDHLKQEIAGYDNEDFPLNINRQCMWKEGITNIPHWHHEVQLCLVTKGSVIFQTPVGALHLQKGEGIYINSGVMHEVCATEDKESEYTSINFDPSLMSRETNVLVWNKYVTPLVLNQAIQVIPLQEEGWQMEVCGFLREVEEVAEKKDFGYELSIMILLGRIWEKLVLNCRQQLLNAYAITQSDWDRLQAFLNCIHQNYMRHLTLGDIARAGNVSRGECCRLFKRTRGQSPITYLTQYRIRQGVKLLIHTELSVADISQQCGFSSSSYFTECFKKEIGMTPLKYRHSSVDTGKPVKK